MAVKPIPDGYHTVTPYLVVKDVARLIEFLEGAFNATTKVCTRGPDGRISHAEVLIGDSFVMMGEAHGPWQPMAAGMYLYVPDVDATYAQAVKAGGVSLSEPTDMFYGDRNAGVKDPVGNTWWIGTHKEDVSPEELERRHAEYAAKKERVAKEGLAVPTVVLAGPLARWLPASRQGERSFVVSGATVRAALDQLFVEVPSLRGYVLDDQGALRHHVAAFVNGVVVRDKQTLAEPVADDGEIYIVQALSGG